MPVPVASAAGPALPNGLIAFRSAKGIGVVDPRSGRERLLLSVPPGCNSAAGGVGPISLAGPVWAPASGPAARLYFWLTDWQSTPTPGCSLPRLPSWVNVGEPILVEADPFDGALRAVAAAPTGLPCQPGDDLAAVPGALAFTDGGCDEPQVQALTLPLEPGAAPLAAPLAVPAKVLAAHCAVGERLLGEGPSGRVLLAVEGTQCAAPPPALESWSPPAHRVGPLLPRPPSSARRELVAAAISPDGRWEAFSLGAQGTGLLDLRRGTWSTRPLARCGSAACTGALEVSFSPSSAQLAVAANGDLLLDPVAGGGASKVLLADGVSAVSWSGVIGAAALEGPRTGRALSVVAPSLWAPLSRFWGAGESRPWRVEPAALPSPTVSVVSLPEPADSLLMLSGKIALAAGAAARTSGDWWRSTDGGRTWKALNPRCSEQQGATPNFMPCRVSQMAALPGGVALARGDPGLGLWRSVDDGAQWHRQPFSGRVIEGGPWAAGSLAYLLTLPARPNSQPAPGAASLLASTDNGLVWHRLLSVPESDPGNPVATLGEFFVLAPGHFAALYRAGDCSLPADLRMTDNGGKVWFSAPPPSLVAPADLARATPSRIVFGAGFCGSAAPHYGQGIFSRPAAAGAGAWAPVHLPAGFRDLYGLGAASRFPASAPTVDPMSVAALSFPGANEGVAVGSAVETGTDSSGIPAAEPSQGFDLIFVSHDGGASWTNESVPGGPPLSVVSCAAPGHCLAAG